MSPWRGRFFRAGGRTNWGKLASVPPTVMESLDYRRMARRVRCRLGNDPIGKQHALAALARQADRRRRIVESNPIPNPDSGVRAFAQAVSTALEGPVLRFSRRQQLIHQAEALGIRRFDANLLIAAVQHRLGNEKVSKPVKPKHNRSPWRLAPFGLAIGVQAVILFGAWSLLHS
jgi:hypothetical protein